MSWFESFEALERDTRVVQDVELAPGVCIVGGGCGLVALAGGAALLAGCRSAPHNVVLVEKDERALEDLVHALRPGAR